MGTFLVATMSTSSGFESTSVTDALAKHITYWFQSRRNQGKVLGNVPSFYFLHKQFGQTPERLIEQTQTELGNYIKELFPESSVAVERQNITGKLNQYTLIISARVINNGVSYDMANAVLITGEQYKLIDKSRLG